MAQGQLKPIERGVYLVGDTPLSLTALAVEGGDGDKNLLAEVLAEELTDDELGELITDLEASRDKDGADSPFWGGSKHPGLSDE